MFQNFRRILLFAVVFLFAASPLASAEGTFEPNWESLRQHNPAPKWFRDAKFGIYFHWGVYSVPAYGDEWYPRHMHDAGGERGHHVFRHHKKTYGDPAEFGYERFVPMFKAEKFDAEAWVELFAKSGARFGSPIRIGLGPHDKYQSPSTHNIGVSDPSFLIGVPIKRGRLNIEVLFRNSLRNNRELFTVL